MEQDNELENTEKPEGSFKDFLLGLGVVKWLCIIAVVGIFTVHAFYPRIEVTNMLYVYYNHTVSVYKLDWFVYFDTILFLAVGIFVLYLIIMLSYASKYKISDSFTFNYGCECEYNEKKPIWDFVLVLLVIGLIMNDIIINARILYYAIF